MCTPSLSESYKAKGLEADAVLAVAKNRNELKKWLTTSMHERIELTRNGSQPRAPKLHIKSKDGSYDRSFNFEYG